jgi:hypothetical protein
MFTLFPHLPFELRALIWYHALPPPRFIHIPEQQKYPPSRHSPTTYLSVSSPPPLPVHLSTCRESRAFILTSDIYSPSFRNGTPKIYFNFAHDVLFLPHYHRHSSLTYLLERFNFASADKLRVRKIAVVGRANLWLGWGLIEILEAFGNVEEVFIICVGDESGGGGVCERLGLPDERDDPLGYVECEIPDGLGTYRFKEDKLIPRFKKMIEEYKKETGDRYGRGFFRYMAEKLRVKLREERDVFLRRKMPGLKTCWEAPDVKIVQVMRRDEARRLVAAREKYWARLEEVEEREWENGPDPQSPFSEQWVDELEIEREYREWGIRW